MSKLIEVTGKNGKKYCTDRTLITGIDYFYYEKEEKEYTLLIIKDKPCLIVQETLKEVLELIEKSEAKEKAPIINFIKLTGAEDKKDIYVNINKINAITPQTANTTAIKVDGDWVFVFETIEEILAKTEEVTK